MREIVEKHNIYTFDELDESVQKKLIDVEIESNVEFYCQAFLFEDMREKAIELLKKNFKDAAKYENLYYSLSYCQGDGAVIEFYLTYNGKELEIKHNGGHYCHSRSFLINGEISEKQEKELFEKIAAINEELESEGYKYIDAARNEADARENLASWEYYSSGKRFDGLEV